MKTEPDLVLGRFRLWVHGRQFPDAQDEWDGNWLNCTAECSGVGAKVKVTGAFISVPNLKSLMDQSSRLYQSLSGAAELSPLEPELRLVISAKNLGHMAVEVELTGDHLNEAHKFKFEVDQTDLNALISRLGQVLERYPLRGCEQR